MSSVTRSISVTVLAWILVSGPMSAEAPIPVGGEFQINAYTSGSQGLPAVSPDGAGGFVVVWYSYGSTGDDASFNSIQGQRFASDGSPAGGQFQVNTYTTHWQTLAAVSPDGAGGFVVAWRSSDSGGTDTSYYSVQARRFASDGSPAGDQFQVNTYTTLHQQPPAVSPDGAGGFVVVWGSSGSSGTDASDSSAQGQRFASDGSPAGDEFQVNTYTTYFQSRPVVASDGAGGFVVVWHSFDLVTSTIKAQRFASNGSPAGNEFKVNSEPTGFGPSFAVNPDGAGGFVVVWSSDESILPPHPPPFSRTASGDELVIRAGESEPTIEAQRYAADGSPVGSQFQVSALTASRTLNTAVSSDGGDGFVVVWQHSVSSGYPYLHSIQGRRFAADGTPRGDQFQVNTYTTESQRVPAVGPDGAGGFVVVWDSLAGEGNDTSFGAVRGQRYALPEIFADGFESGDTETWSVTVGR